MKHTATRAPRFDREWKEMIALLPDNRQAILENAIREYQLKNIEPTDLEGAEIMAFILIKKIVDRRTRQRAARLRKQQDVTLHNSEEKSEKLSSEEPSEKSLSALSDTKTRPHLSTKRTERNVASERRAIVRRFNRLSTKASHKHKRR